MACQGLPRPGRMSVPAPETGRRVLRRLRSPTGCPGGRKPPVDAKRPAVDGPGRTPRARGSWRIHRPRQEQHFVRHGRRDVSPAPRAHARTPTARPAERAPAPSRRNPAVTADTDADVHADAQTQIRRRPGNRRPRSRPYGHGRGHTPGYSQGPGQRAGPSPPRSPSGQLAGATGRQGGRCYGVRVATSATASAATCAVRTASTAWAAFAAMSVRCCAPSSRMRPTAR